MRFQDEKLSARSLRKFFFLCFFCLGKGGCQLRGERMGGWYLDINGILFTLFFGRVGGVCVLCFGVESSCCWTLTVQHVYVYTNKSNIYCLCLHEPPAVHRKMAKSRCLCTDIYGTLHTHTHTHEQQWTITHNYEQGRWKLRIGNPHSTPCPTLEATFGVTRLVDKTWVVPSSLGNVLVSVVRPVIWCQESWDNVIMSQAHGGEAGGRWWGWRECGIPVSVPKKDCLSR